ncbi:MAG: SRPBCC family protein [Planctomycetota bacterium]|nr:SRPBCC family protein [Planctomycetota bacterium]
MHLAFDVLIRAPQEVVFDFLANPAKRPLWQPSIRTLELETKGPPRLGTRWRESVRGAGSFDMDICAYERPTRWAERLESRVLSGTVSLTFAPDPEGTRVTLAADLRGHGLMRLVEPIARLVLRREMRRDLGRVGAILRAGT